MSKYTITVYELEQNQFDFGLKDYSIFDEAYRPILNGAILDYYRFHEIGFSNPALWRERLNTKINRLMREKYNKMYLNKMKEFNPLYNIEIIETFTREAKGNSKNRGDSRNVGTDVVNGIEINNGEEEAKGLSVASQFPSEEMTEGDLTDNIYVDSASKQTSNSTNKDKSSSHTVNTSNSNLKNSSSINSLENENYKRETIGSSAGLPFSKAMLQFKEYLEKFQLDKQIIDDLGDLFMNLY